MELNDMIEALKSAMDKPASSTMDVIADARKYVKIGMVAKQGCDELRALKTSVPEDLYPKIDEKIELINELGVNAMEVSKAIMKMIPCAQKLDISQNEGRERLKRHVGGL